MTVRGRRWRIVQEEAAMQGWFRIETEADRRLIRLTMGGFFDSDTVGRLRAEMVRAVAGLGLGAGGHDTVCDIREMHIQSQERVEEFSRLVGMGDIRSRRLAFVTAPGLARLQARRLTDREGVAFFTDPASALDWLAQ